jgi:hypothetical protein
MIPRPATSFQTGRGTVLGPGMRRNLPEADISQTHKLPDILLLHSPNEAGFSIPGRRFIDQI